MKLCKNKRSGDIFFFTREYVGITAKRKKIFRYEVFNKNRTIYVNYYYTIKQFEKYFIEIKSKLGKL